MSAPTTTLLRFMNVRPVQKRDDLDPVVHTLSLDDLSSKFLEQLLNATSRADAKQSARTFIHSDAYISGFGAQEPWVVYLRDIWRALASVRDQTTLDKLRAKLAALSAPSDPANDRAGALQNVRTQLWESLLAVFVAPKEDPRDRSELIQLMRAAEALRKQQALKSVDDARILLEARPVVPTELLRFGGRVEGNGNGQAPDPPTTRNPISERLPAINALREQYRALDAAIRDLELNDRRARDTSDPEQEVLSFNGSTGTAVAVVSTAKRVATRLPATVIERLSPETIKTVQSTGMLVDQDRLSDISSVLAERKSAAVDQLYRLGGAIAIENLEHHDVDVILGPHDFPHWPDDIFFPENFERPIEGSVGTVRPLGMGDLLVLRETVLGYDLGEIAYIENVLQSESRSRVHRRLDRLETTLTRTSTQSEETERDLTTNERFQLSTQVEKTVTSDLSLEVGLAVSASYGVVKVDANTDFAVSSSVEEAQRSATEYSQEITERSVSKLTQSLTETLTQTVLNEVEETNTHGFDNTSGAGNIAGIYRYVDKLCQAQVFKYGQRMMLEFIVPEPAAFYLHGRTNPTPPKVLLEEPAPLPPDFGFKQVTRDNYHIWVKAYHVNGVEPPPPTTLIIGKSIEQPTTVDELKNKDTLVTTRSDQLQVPDGYVATYCWIYGNWYPFEDFEYIIQAVVGRSYIALKSEPSDPMSNETGDIPIVISSRNVQAFAVTVEVECQCTNEHLVAWKIATWQKIVEAHNGLKAAFDAQTTSTEIQQANADNSTPPALKRDIAETELMKGCLVLLTNQHFASLDAVTEDAAPYGYPELRVGQSMHEGPYMQFFQQCIEWNQMTYTYYPYFWGRKENWVDRSRLDDADPGFAAFLRAGAARVVVPVRLGYDDVVSVYLETGEIWGGGETPVIGDDLYISILDELAAALDLSLENAEPYGPPWEYTLPTTLVMLQSDSTLPTFAVTP